MSKSTDVELVEILEQRNMDGDYDEIIANAKNKMYHDYESDEVCPKITLTLHLAKFPELADVLEDVKSGEYDE